MMAPLLGRAPGPSELEPFTLELVEWFSSLPEGAVARGISDLDTGPSKAFPSAVILLRRWAMRRCCLDLSVSMSARPTGLSAYRQWLAAAIVDQASNSRGQASCFRRGWILFCPDFSRPSSRRYLGFPVPGCGGLRMPIIKVLLPTQRSYDPRQCAS